MIIYIKKIIFFIFKKMINPEWIQQAIDGEKIKYVKNSCNFKESTIFGRDTKILNFQNDKNAINIGENSIILGELRVNKYGGKIEIGDFTHIGENTRIWSADNVKIGNNVQISHNVNIIDNNTHSLNPEKRADEYLETLQAGTIVNKNDIKVGTIIIEDNVWISFNVTILKNVKIGKNSVIGANSFVTGNIEENVLAVGNPAKIIKKLSF